MKLENYKKTYKKITNSNEYERGVLLKTPSDLEELSSLIHNKLTASKQSPSWDGTLETLNLELYHISVSDLEKLIQQLRKQINDLEEQRDTLNATNSVSVELHKTTCNRLGL